MGLLRESAGYVDSGFPQFLVSVELESDWRTERHVLIDNLHCPRKVRDWLNCCERLYYFDESEWHWLTVYYRGYSEYGCWDEEMEGERITVRDFNQGVRWPEFVHWLEWNMWSLKSWPFN